MEKETLEEAAERICSCERDITFFEIGTKWQQERSYSEEEVLEIIYKFKQTCPYFIEEWFEQFKNK